MSDLVEFATSKEVIIVGGVVLTAALLILIVFLIERSYYKRKQHKNTKLINEIVEDEKNNSVEEKEVIPIINQTEVVTPTIKEENENEQLEILDEQLEDKPLVIPIEEFNENRDFSVQQEEIKSNEVELPQERDSIESIYNEVKEEVEQLQYTDVEPNKEEAKEELRKATEELIKQEQEVKEENIDLTKFEAEQEENAIISLDELMQKSEVLYQQNEVSQYKDEGNEPISIEDLEQRMKNIKVEIEQLEQEEKVKIPEIEEVVIPEMSTIDSQSVDTQKVKLDDLDTIENSTKAYREDVVFKSSPIISPIFGIEETKTESNLELENTANYDKLDEEIKKTNQFLATLKELQHKLD